jgi:hypothetical protein
VGGIGSRLGRLERAEDAVDRRVEEEIEGILNLLEEHLSSEEYRRILCVIASEGAKA